MLTLALGTSVFAQPRMGAWGDATNADNNNFYINYVGERVLVTAPASIAGTYIYTISNDGIGTTDWGKAIKDVSPAILNVDIVKADPYEACATLNNAAALNGKIALIKRGNCEFGAKALAAQNAGAVAVIIVNQNPGPPVGMGAGAQGANVTIPVIMVSDVDGAKIEAQVTNGAKMSMTVWSNGYSDDIGFVNKGLSLSPAYSIPLTQIQGSSAKEMKGFDGAVIANFGTTTATNIQVIATVKWTPTNGSTSVVHKDTVTVASLSQGDSIRTPFVDANYSFAPTQTGRYDVEYELIPGNFTDQFVGDNTASYSFYIDEKIYSKGRYDFANNEPFSAVGYRLSNGGNFTWGPLYYMEKEKYVFENAQFRMSGDQTDMSNTGTVLVFLYKWTDANANAIIEATECNVVGFGQKDYTTGDTSGQIFTVPFKDPNGGNSPVVTEANSWYWAAITVPNNVFLSVDGVSNYFMRSWGRVKATDSIREPYAPFYPDHYQTFSGDISTPTTGVPLHYPFERFFVNEDSTRFSQQKNGLVPSIPLQMSLFPVDVNNVSKESALDVTLYPNPATEVVNISLNLDKAAEEVTYTVISSVGSIVLSEKHNNVTSDKFSVSTAKLAAGDYFIAIKADDDMILRKFSVIK